jgi:Tol biopolymer transport system component
VALRLDSGAAAVISHDAAEPVYSPDGSRIALVGMKSPVDRDIYVTNTDGTALTQMTDSRPIEQTPSWDPSGQRLAFLRLSGAETLAAFSGIGDALLQINADGSCPTKIASAPGVAYLSPTWQPGPGREAGPIAC